MSTLPPNPIQATPRTEAYVLPNPVCVTADFARELERETNVLRFENNLLKAEREKLIIALDELRTTHGTPAITVDELDALFGYKDGKRPRPDYNADY